MSNEIFNNVLLRRLYFQHTFVVEIFKMYKQFFIAVQCLTTFFQMGDKQNIAPNYISSFVPINKGDNQVWMNGDFNNVESKSVLFLKNNS